MKTGRGAQRATNSCASTGKSLGVERTGVFQEVAGHPMIFGSGGDVFDLLAEVAAKDLGAAGAGGADEGDGETLVVGHGNERGLSVARETFDADLFGVNGGVGFEIVEGAAGSPGPSAECSPIVETCEAGPC